MESVWDYPRPPAVVRCERQVRIEFGGVTIADSGRALRVLETASPPTVYVPLEDVADEHLDHARNGTPTFCEWKGTASYLDVIVNAVRCDRVAWWYPQPTAAYERLRDHAAFYPARVDCYLDDERVAPQPGAFYGGWVTGDIEGPCKRARGTLRC